MAVQLRGQRLGVAMGDAGMITTTYFTDYAVVSRV